MVWKLLTSRIVWSIVGLVALGFLINNWISRMEKSIRTKIETEIALVAKDAQIKSIEDRLAFLVSEHNDTKLILTELNNKNQQVKVVTNEITREIIEKAVPQPIAPLSPVLADTSEALAEDWEKTYGSPK